MPYVPEASLSVWRPKAINTDSEAPGVQFQEDTGMADCYPLSVPL